MKSFVAFKDFKGTREGLSFGISEKKDNSNNVLQNEVD